MTSFTRGGWGHPPYRDHVTLSVTSRHVGQIVKDIRPDAVGVIIVRCFDGPVVKTSRCGREDPGSNPGRGIFFTLFGKIVFSLVSLKSLKELNCVRPFI